MEYSVLTYNDNCYLDGTEHAQLVRFLEKPMFALVIVMRDQGKEDAKIAKTLVGAVVRSDD